LTRRLRQNLGEGEEEFLMQDDPEADRKAKNKRKAAEQELASSLPSKRTKFEMLH